ncbi:MAG: bile acid:sodium symporter [Opitutales bacterium]|nr:bile acid:sodium symporter [Opitutales bacterium]
MKQGTHPGDQANWRRLSNAIIRFVWSHGFLICLFSCIVLAHLFPEVGKKGGVLKTDVFAGYGVWFVFFSLGLTLPRKQLIAGLVQWRIHVMIQIWILMVSPLLAWVLLALAPGEQEPAMRNGLLLLSFLPTTVFSSILFTQRAGGDPVIAIVNSALSNVLAVFTIPLMCAFMISEPITGGLSVAEAILKLARTILIPLALGMLVRPILRVWVDRFKRAIKWVDYSVLCLIVFTAFSNSVSDGLWTKYDWPITLEAFLLTTALLGIQITLVMWLRKRVPTSQAVRSAIFFSSTQKALATGGPILMTLFGASPNMGMIIFPLLIYHPIQLMVAPVIAHRFHRAGSL